MEVNLKKGINVTIISIIENIFLAIFKFLAGLLGKSNALISDSIHTLSDILSSIVVIVGLKLSSKEEDKSHPYGHERFECVAAFILSTFLFITGILIGIVGIKTIFYNDYSTIEPPTTIALVAAIISIITKEGMYWYTRSAALKIKSDSLMADAWHHRSDSLSSIGSLIGIGGAMLGFKLLDPIASIIICFCIIKAAYDIFIDSVNKMIDKSCDDAFIEEIKKLVLKIEGVKNIDFLKTRLFGNKIYIDIEIGADANLTLKEAHQIAHNVHDNIENTFKDVKHCMVHVNPK